MTGLDGSKHSERPERPEFPVSVKGKRRRKRSPRARIAILVSGWFFIVLGILGLFLPILQGILFLAIGAYLLSLESPRARRLIQIMRRRYPRLGRTFDTAQLRTTRVLRRISARFR